MNFVDYTGRRYGNLVVIKRGDRNKKRNLYEWICKCDCGTIKPIIGSDLRNGNSTSCGCMSSRKKIGEINKTHGLAKTRFYKIWCGMKTRCYNKNEKSYAYYGAKGITVCDKWHIFDNFYNDMFSTYSDDLTLERINVRGNYSPDNCTWITKQEQSLNKTDSFIVDYKGKKISLVKLCYENEIKNYKQIKRRITQYGWDIEKALTTPIKQFKKNSNII